MIVITAVTIIVSVSVIVIIVGITVIVSWGLSSLCDVDPAL